MNYIKVFKGVQEISQGDETNPLVVGPLNASLDEVSAPIELDIKSVEGFKSLGDTVISFVGTTAAKWEVCATSGGIYAPTLTISEEINTVGKKFYVKAKASSDESPVNDITVDIKITATIQAL